MVVGFERDEPARGPTIQGFTAHGFSIDGVAYGGLFLTPERASEWNAPDIVELALEHLVPLLALQPQPEFLLLGTGAKLRFPPRALVKALDDRGIGLEAMDSRAAARTWGVLRSEERWITAAIMPLG